MEEPGKVDKGPLLNGARVLVVEDDFIIAMELELILLDAGAEIVKLCRSVKEALASADQNELSVAILDVRLGQETVTPVARHLVERDIPFVFYTGQVDMDPVLAEWTSYKVIQKPAHPKVIVKALADKLRQ